MIIYQHLPPLKKIPWILEGNLWYRNMLYELKKQQIVRLYNCKRRSVNKFSSLSKTRWRVSTIIILHLFFERSFCDYAIMNDKRVVPNWLPVFFHGPVLAGRILIILSIGHWDRNVPISHHCDQVIELAPRLRLVGFFFCKVICLGKEKWNAIEFLIRYN